MHRLMEKSIPIAMGEEISPFVEPYQFKVTVVWDENLPYPQYKSDAFGTIARWCVDTFGSDDAYIVDSTTELRGWFYPDRSWCYFMGSFWFKSEQDAFEFKIRWG
jgi:hypothetical protein